MDRALELRIKVEQEEPIESPFEYLNQSEIVQRYSEMTDLKPLGKIFALVGLAEIPYTEQLPLTQELIAFVNQHLATIGRLFIHWKNGKDRSMLQRYALGSLLSTGFRKIRCSAKRAELDQAIPSL